MDRKGFLGFVTLVGPHILEAGLIQVEFLGCLLVRRCKNCSMLSSVSFSSFIWYRYAARG